ncbi:MAG: DUF2946 family protein [Betaproteobacteria bacterium]|jgi:hypothetical protein|nr:DUF2946 family protein [Betaproteobacteria bacterium]
MDDIVLRGMAKWPNVPAVYGWLSLDRRGHWLLKGDRVANPGIAAFFGRNYSHDEQGRWFFQNGPQRVYVALAYTPHVYRVNAATDTTLALASHTGAPVKTVDSAYIDETGQLLLDTDLGIGLVHDADLATLVPRFGVAGAAAGDAALATTLDALQAGEDVALQLNLGSTQIPVRPIRAAKVPARFGYEPRPVQPAGEEECY